MTSFFSSTVARRLLLLHTRITCSPAPAAAPISGSAITITATAAGEAAAAAAAAITAATRQLLCSCCSSSCCCGCPCHGYWCCYCTASRTARPTEYLEYSEVRQCPGNTTICRTGFNRRLMLISLGCRDLRIWSQSIFIVFTIKAHFLGQMSAPQ